MKSGLKLLMISVASGLLGSAAYLTAGATGDSVAVAYPTTDVCEVRSGLQGAVVERCLRDAASAYAASPISMGQIFAMGPRR